MLATMRLLEQKLKDVSFGIVSEISKNEIELRHAYRHIMSAFPSIKLAPKLLPEFDPKGGLISRYFSAAMYIARSAYMASRKLSFGEGNIMINESDMVVSKGGHMLHCVKKANPIHWLNLYSHLYPLILAREAGVPYILWGHSLGPFHDAVSRNFTAKIFRDAELIGVRETISYDIACQMGVPKKKIRLMPDPAFGIQPKYSSKLETILAKYSLEQDRFLAITVRPWGKVSDGSYEHYIEKIAEIVRHLFNARFCNRIGIIVHVLGPTTRENDLFASRLLYNKLSGLPVSLVDDDLSPEEVSALYGKAKFLIGTRFHSVIFSLVAGTPVYALSYFGPKALGIMKDLDMNSFVSDLSDLKVYKALKTILSADLERMRGEILIKVDNLKERLNLEADFMAHLVQGKSI